MPDFNKGIFDAGKQSLSFFVGKPLPASLLGDRRAVLSCGAAAFTTQTVGGVFVEVYSTPGNFLTVVAAFPARRSSLEAKLAAALHSETTAIR